MARRRSYGRPRRGRRSNKLPIISLAILGGQVAGAWYSSGNLVGALSEFTSFYTGYDFMQRRFELQKLAIGYGPWVVKRFVGAVARPRVKGIPGISLS